MFSKTALFYFLVLCSCTLKNQSSHSETEKSTHQAQVFDCAPIKDKNSNVKFFVVPEDVVFGLVNYEQGQGLQHPQWAPNKWILIKKGCQIGLGTDPKIPFLVRFEKEYPLLNVTPPKEIILERRKDFKYSFITERSWNIPKTAWDLELLEYYELLEFIDYPIEKMSEGHQKNILSILRADYEVYLKSINIKDDTPHKQALDAAISLSKGPSTISDDFLKLLKDSKFLPTNFSSKERTQIRAYFQSQYEKKDPKVINDIMKAVELIRTNKKNMHEVLKFSKQQ